MRKLLVGLVMVAMGLLLISPVVNATPVAVGDYITITDSVGGSNGLGGGAFNVAIGSGPVLFDTFCVEMLEHIIIGQSYWIGGITSGAVNGGVGGSPDPISSQTAYLYAQWEQLPSAGKTDATANAYQLAIWAFEQEYTNPPTDTAALDLYNAAKTAVGSSTSLYGVQVLNLYTTRSACSTGWCYSGLAQDLLVYTPVPEPATMLLFGLGLLGLAGIGRKYKK